MPPVQRGASPRSGAAGPLGPLQQAPDFGYRYPVGLNLEPRSDMHKRLLNAIIERVAASHQVMSQRYDTWRQLDRTLNVYIEKSEEEEEVEQEDARKPTSIVVPVSYAILGTMLTFLITRFLSNPIFRFRGRSAKHVLGARLLEKIVEIQDHRNQFRADLRTMFRSGLVYGMGPITPVWEVETGYRPNPNRANVTNPASDPIPQANDAFRERVVTFEGNRLYNIEPYRYFPQPNVASWKTRDMEYVSWIDHTNRMSILSEEQSRGGRTFNAQYLAYIDGLSNFTSDDTELAQSKRTRQGNDADRNAMDRIYMYWKLVPSEWGLGRSNYPETWVFSVVGDQVIVEARPLEHNHQHIPIVCYSPDTDGFSPTPLARIETVYGHQKVTDYIVNSRVESIRKSLHDMFIADPSRVNIQTFLEPGPGKLILTNQHSWGQGVDGALEQLQVQDVTQDHIVEAGLLAQQAEDITGATDVTQGKFPGGERKSAREVGAVFGSAISRLEDLGIMADLQCLQPLGMMIGSQTQQYMSQEQHIEVVGRHSDYIRRMFPNVDPSFVVVDPLSLSVDYHVEVNDGKLRAQSDPNLWKEVYALLIQNPEAINEISSVKVFKYMVELMGVPNIDQFDKDDPAARVQVRADEAVLDDVERGRLTELQGAAA